MIIVKFKRCDKMKCASCYYDRGYKREKDCLTRKLWKSQKQVEERHKDQMEYEEAYDGH